MKSFLFALALCGLGQKWLKQLFINLPLSDMLDCSAFCQISDFVSFSFSLNPSFITALFKNVSTKAIFFYLSLHLLIVSHSSLPHAPTPYFSPPPIFSPLSMSTHGLQYNYAGGSFCHPISIEYLFFYWLIKATPSQSHIINMTPLRSITSAGQ